jgi:hypothetical protein
VATRPPLLLRPRRARPNSRLPRPRSWSFPTRRKTRHQHPPPPARVGPRARAARLPRSRMGQAGKYRSRNSRRLWCSTPGPTDPTQQLPDRVEPPPAVACEPGRHSRHHACSGQRDSTRVTVAAGTRRATTVLGWRSTRTSRRNTRKDPSDRTSSASTSSSRRRPLAGRKTTRNRRTWNSPEADIDHGQMVAWTSDSFRRWAGRMVREHPLGKCHAARNAPAKAHGPSPAMRNC